MEPRARLVLISLVWSVSPMRVVHGWNSMHSKAGGWNFHVETG